ncbi:MAG TPA: SRPBCC domain-containing protein [Polyangiaceae bacterium]|nr:SRPBCC domain-containing protein [Polyangiaceae bacterium]
MNSDDLTLTLSLAASPEAVFAAINDPRAWWSGTIEGQTDALGAEFTYAYKSMHRSRQRVSEWVPGKRVVWHVIDSQLTFVKDPSEWKGTDIVFDLVRQGDGTQLTLTHRGLRPTCECFDACSSGWSSLATENLRSLVERRKTAQSDKSGSEPMPGVRSASR